MVARVTNTMISNTLMNNLNNNLRRVDDLQNQLSSGKRYANISDNPTSLIFAQAARNRMTRVMHYQEMVSVSRNWLTQAESGVMELQKVIGAVYEELVSAGGTMTPEDRQNLAKVVGQMNDHFVDTLNTPFGDRFVFGGYNTPGDFATSRSEDGLRPFVVHNGVLYFNGFDTSQFDGMTFEEFNADPPPAGSPLEILRSLMSDIKSLEVGPGIEMPITMNGLNVLFYTTHHPETGEFIVRNAFNVMQDVFLALDGDPTPLETDGLTRQIALVQGAQNHMLNLTAEIGGRQRRLDLLDARYERDLINYGQMRSDAEDADIAEVIMDMRMAETVYQAALSAGARVIQPTLMDFLR